MRNRGNNKSRILLALFTVIVGLLAIGCGTQTQDYDLVIINGRVMDPETDFDGVRHVGIRDGLIVTITEDAIEGKVGGITAAGAAVEAPVYFDVSTVASNGTVQARILLSWPDGTVEIVSWQQQ